MSEINKRLEEISDKMSAHSVKGTLELLDASVSEDDLRSLILKAIGRMEKIQGLSDELFAVLEKLLEKIGEKKNGKET